MNKLLQMENLERHYETPAGVVKALDGIDCGFGAISTKQSNSSRTPKLFKADPNKGSQPHPK